MWQTPNKKKMEELFLKTPDVQSVSSLMYAAIDLVQRVHVAFDAGGLRISEEACQGNMFMFASLRAENFEEYTCKGAGVLCFNPEHLYRVLSNRQQRDVMTWTYKAPRRALVINVQSDDDGTLHEYTIPLENDLGESFEAPSIEVDYVLLFDTAQISNIVNGFGEFDNDFAENWLRVTCTPQSIQFDMAHGCMINKMQYVLHTMRPTSDPATTSKKRRTQAPHADTSVTRTVRQEDIVQEYRLAYLQNMVKCFSINRGSVFMYIKRDFPLVFEIKVGVLGELRLALMFRSNE
mmetsp:Transcript_18506/g.32824  ORF Transcript_18506/g.32824 Transcript_18506/m.32824 type:complete len:292 (-) Transcript_18506:21-896(-)